MKPSGAHTHGTGGGGSAVLLVAAALVIAAVAGPVAAAVAEIVRLLLIAVVVLAGTAVLGLAGVVAYRVRQDRSSARPAVTVTARRLHRPSGAVQAHRPPAIARPAELHLHLHVDAGQAAEIIRQASQHPPAEVKED